MLFENPKALGVEMVIAVVFSHMSLYTMEADIHGFFLCVFFYYLCIVRIQHFKHHPPL